MKRHAYVLFSIVLAGAVWYASALPPATAEEVSYSFDFNDRVVPGELTVGTYAEVGDPTDTITCDASSGQLRIYDTVSSSTGLFLYPEDILTDTRISVEVTDTHGSAFLSARDDLGTVEDYSNYGCWLWRSPTTAGVALYLNKNANGRAVYSTKTSVISHPGPYVLELDVIDRETSLGAPYTSLQARLLYNDGQNSLTLQANDFGTLGGHERIASGYALLGAILGSDQRNAGWTLDVTFDDLTIRGTLLGGDRLEGDLSGDGVVNSTDLDIVRANWGQSVSPHTNGDADGDGLVASGDLDIVRANWGATGGANVPEPGMIITGALGAALLMWRRRRGAVRARSSRGLPTL